MTEHIDLSHARLLAIAQRRRWTTDERALAAAVRAVSDRYNDASGVPFARLGPDALAARLLFWLPRDVPKATEAVRELVRCGDLAGDTSRPLRVLDLGAGLGAGTLGLMRALPAGASIEATLVDADPATLSVAGELLGAGVTVRTGDVTRVEGGPWDVIIAMQVLSELDRDKPTDARLAAHAALLGRWTHALADHGSLVIIEPALRERARHLHAIPLPPNANVYAPCLHEQSCALPERDWCHEDRPVDLPAELVPIARASGLRYERLTFAYRIVRKDGRTLRQHLGGAPCARVVGAPPRTKGRCDKVVCSDDGRIMKIGRLDRHATDANEAFDDLARGDLIATPPDRVGPDDPIRSVGSLRS